MSDIRVVPLHGDFDRLFRRNNVSLETVTNPLALVEPFCQKHAGSVFPVVGPPRSSVRIKNKCTTARAVDGRPRRAPCRSVATYRAVVRTVAPLIRTEEARRTTGNTEGCSRGPRLVPGTESLIRLQPNYRKPRSTSEVFSRSAKKSWESSA